MASMLYFMCLRIARVRGMTVTSYIVRRMWIPDPTLGTLLPQVGQTIALVNLVVYNQLSWLNIVRYYVTGQDARSRWVDLPMTSERGGGGGGGGRKIFFNCSGI